MIGCELQSEATSVHSAKPMASEDQPEGPSTMDRTKACDDIIDLEEGQLANETDAKDEQGVNLQSEATSVHSAKPMASEDQPEGPSTMDSTKASDDIIDLEEGQLANETDAKDEQGVNLQAEAMYVNRVEVLTSEQQPEERPSNMGSTKVSVEIIDLGEGQAAYEDPSKDVHEGMLQAEALNVNRVEPLAPEHESEDGPSIMNNMKPSGETIDLEEGQLEDMDLTDDNVVVAKHEQLDASVQSQTTVATVHTLHGVSAELDKGNGPKKALIHASDSMFIGESPTRGVKRPRMESTEPSVRVIYNNLTRESKSMLMELIHKWSEWQARKQHNLGESVEEVLECGEETCYRALHVGLDKSCAVSFWMDNQARGNFAVDDGAVPLYDREFTLGSTPLGDSSNIQSNKDKDDTRCFNCGSYSHSLNDCPKPRDNVAISNARKQHNSKRNQSSVNLGQNRYYQKTPGKFDDLRPGVLGSETRECLGIGENDPPPWLHRMRELGYPPAYLNDDDYEDKPSGITIFGDGEVKADHEGELPEQGSPSPPEKRKTVEFPGINAPVPENGDPLLWGSAPPQSSSGRHHSSDQREHRDRGPPGTEHYSSRYHSHDYGAASSPDLRRSHSDRGQRSSSGYGNPPADDGPCTPHTSSSRQHSSQHSSSSEMSYRHSRDRDRDRQDKHYYNRR